MLNNANQSADINRNNEQPVLENGIDQHQNHNHDHDAINDDTDTHCQHREWNFAFINDKLVDLNDPLVDLHDHTYFHNFNRDKKIILFPDKLLII